MRRPAAIAAAVTAIAAAVAAVAAIAPVASAPAAGGPATLATAQQQPRHTTGPTPYAAALHVTRSIGPRPPPA